MKLVARKRGRIAGALVGGLLLGPLGAVAGAALNSKTDYELARDKPKAPPLSHPTEQLRMLKWVAIGGSPLWLFLAACVIASFFYGS